IPSWEKWNGVDKDAAKREEKRRKDAAERKRRQREREKLAAEKAAKQAADPDWIDEDTSDDEPSPVTPNVTRDVTRDGHAVTELEKEREIEKEPSLREGVQPPLLGVVEPATASPPRRAMGEPKDEQPNPHASADRIAKDWYERNKTTSAQSFVAVRSIIRPLVQRGIDPELLAAAMDAVAREGRPISQGTLTVAMNRLTRPQAASQDPYGNVTPIHQSPATRAASAAMERARRYAEEDGLTLAEALEA
ncbi:MAG TPA: hypothetical protein VGS97_10040, partial [Actinocrinis sp.]|uniref:hypothetical protein n=1 Tax=Actinocrinis sp. TaxID=1920516 RepID=UPI002DDCE502